MWFLHIGDITQLTTDQKDNLTNAINSTNDKFKLLWEKVDRANNPFTTTNSNSKWYLVKLNKGSFECSIQFIFQYTYGYWNDGSNTLYSWTIFNIPKPEDDAPLPQNKKIYYNFAIADDNIGIWSYSEIVNKQFWKPWSAVNDYDIYEYKRSGVPYPITFNKTNNQQINFTMPGSYWEKQYVTEQEELEKERKKREIAKLSDIKPLEDKISEIKPIVDDLHQKDEHLMKTLGLHPDYKYYKKNEGDDS
ncbi:hypothetical protein [Spiroplasma endosymbiont of Ammophila pubescens]|uniref:hypothetical protein n=1 Tax=Spiroplasma endosymbiont of Ammophila pubescens TaxID=3066315 RepID=UPI0032B21A26